ncbi:MAG: selenide, water dikinase SelD [Synechococcus sp.]
MQSPAIAKNLVLVGAGHSHAIALKLLGMKPIPGVQVTLITETTYTPYSGMLPGHVAGYYSVDDCHIDMRPLAQFANTRLLIDRVVGLDLDRQEVLCANRPPVHYDVLSINIGSTPAKANAPGAEKYAIPSKPIRGFLTRWHQVVEEIEQQPDRPWTLAIVGGGVGGVELSLNMRERLHAILQAAGQPTSNLTIHLFQRGGTLVPDLNAKARQLLTHNLQEKGIRLHLEQPVVQVQPDRIICESGLDVECDRIFWVTQASAQSWIAESGLATDERGFIALRPTLQSESHANVFAAGDISSVTAYPRPKAGVFAVRQGKPLYENLRRMVLGQSPKEFIPQKDFLRIIGTGSKSAVACKWDWACESHWMWKWKEWIEFRFMDKFREFPEMDRSTMSSATLPQGLADTETLQELSQAAMRCGGCGSKVGSSVLGRVLSNLKDAGAVGTESSELVEKESSIVVGLDAPDDAAVLRVPSDRLLVQTLDYFKAIIDEPYLVGQIATHHCLSDLFAMGAEPHSVLALASVPYATERIMESNLTQLMLGSLKVLREAGAELIGGHSVEGTEIGFGLSCNGLVHPDRLLTKAGLQPGQRLILTKPLGTGVLFAAHMRLRAEGRWIDGALQSMLQSNQQVAKILRQFGVSACTDVTGFGLLGHLVEMMRASGVSVSLDLEAIPLLDGVLSLFEAGFASSLQSQNVWAARYVANVDRVSHLARYPVLFDPQTSGGLLAAVESDRVSDCLDVLHQAGYWGSCAIGVVTEVVLGKSRVHIGSRFQ